MWRLPIPELATVKQNQAQAVQNNSPEQDEKIKNLLKVVQLLRHVQSQKATQGKTQRTRDN